MNFNNFEMRSTNHLQAAVGHYSYFDQVSTMLMRLTTSWSITQEFALHFPKSKELQLFVTEYLIRVVQLCRKVFVVSKRSPTMLFAASIFSSFDQEFGSAQQELDQWGLLIEKKFSSLAVEMTRTGHVETAKAHKSLVKFISKRLSTQQRLEQQQRFLASLSPSQGYIESTWMRERKKGDCSWILNTPVYQSWKTRASASTLRITGHLGSGKTVAMANIVADLSRQKNCAYYFCKRRDGNSLNANDIFGSIAYQMTQSTISKCNWSALDQGAHTLMSTLNVGTAAYWLSALLPSDEDYYIVLDGLEECHNQEFEELINGLLQLQSTFKLFVCISSRPDSGMLREFDKHWVAQTLSMKDSERDDELRSYITKEVRMRNNQRQTPFEPQLEDMIIQQLALGAQGM